VAADTEEPHQKNQNKAMNKLITFIIASFVLATSAMAMIGQTADQIIQAAQRDKDTTAIRWDNFGGMPELRVDYKDGSYIRHTFGADWREMVFHVSSYKRLSADDVFRIQRAYHTTWRGIGTQGGHFQWLSASGLQMFAERHEAYDVLTIFDLNKSAEIKSAIAASAAPTPAPAPAVAPLAPAYYPPPPSSPSVVPTPDQKDCLLVATEAFARLKTTASWARIAGFIWTENTKEIGGHAVVFFQPTTDTNVFMYDKTGSYDLHTKSHDLSEIAAALNQLLRVSEIRVKSARWMESDESIKEFAGAAGKLNRQPIWSNTAANSTEQTLAYQVGYLLGFGMILALFASTAVICFLKGKPVFAVLGILALLFGGLSLWALIGACRIAKPTSWWARKKYGPEKMNIAHQRFTPSFGEA
jgi:hypothetical protein